MQPVRNPEAVAMGEKTPLLRNESQPQQQHTELRIVDTAADIPRPGQRRRSRSFSDLHDLHEKPQHNSKQPPIHEDQLQQQLDQFASDEKAAVKPKIYYLKIGVIFCLCFISCAVIAATPEKQQYFHLYTVSRFRSPSVNVTAAIPSYSVLLVKLRGAMLYSPTQTTSNITIVVQSLSDDDNASVIMQRWTVPVVPGTENEASEEIVREKYFAVQHQGSDKQIKITMETEYLGSIPLALSYEALTDAVYNEVIYAALILLFVYALIILELVHRALAAMVGSLMSIAVLSLVNRRPSLEEVIQWLDFETLSLLFGMMVMVGIFSESGFFDWVAVLAYKLAKGRTMALVTLLCLFAAVISAFLDNVTTILLMTPVTIRLCEVLRLDPKHLIMAQVLFSNIGGTATAVGDPPNVIIASNSELADQGVNFTNFTLHMTIGIVFVTIGAYGFLRIIYRKQSSLESNEDPSIAEVRREVEVWRRTAYGFAVTTSEQAAVKALLQAKICELEHKLARSQATSGGTADFIGNLAVLESKYKIKDKELLIKCSIVLSAVILLFFLSSTVEQLHLDLGWIALMGAIALLVLTDFADLDTLLHRIEWSTLIFFAALFALMEALRELNLISWIGQQMQAAIVSLPESSQLPVAILIVLWVSALASAFIDNIPFTTAMIPIILELSDVLPILPLVWSLAFGACLGGNGTLIGASANVVAAGIAEQNGYPFSFVQFFRIGFPMMLVTVAIATAYLLLCHSVFGWNFS